MEDVLPKQPFFARHEFVGKLSKGDEVVNKLHVIVQYSLIKEGEITGKVLGSAKVCERLRRIAELSDPFVKLTCEEPEHITTKISSEKTLLRKIRHRPAYTNEMTYVVADLNFEDVTITKRIGPLDSPDRHLTFFLSGPRTLWSIRETREFSFTGETRNKVYNSRIELNEDFPFEVEVLPWYFHERTPAPNNHELRANVLAMHLKTKASLDRLANKDFVNLGRALADDLTLLVSFLSRRWVAWYQYELVTNDTMETYVRKTRKCSTARLDWSDTFIAPEQSRDFLRIGLTNLRKLRAEGFDLLMPIAYFVSGHEAEHLEEQFATLFLSLEKIKDMFALKEGLRKNLRGKAFGRLASLISDVIKKNPASAKVFDRIEPKIAELNRPSLRFVLESLFQRYRIDWRDVYPQASDLTLLKTRDKLFHSSEELDADLLVKEFYRLQAIVQRLLLRLLGWVDLSHSPPDFMKRRLSAYSE